MRHLATRSTSALAASLAATITVATAQAAPGVDIRNAAARVVVVPEARADVTVTVHSGSSGLPRLSARVQGDQVVLDGGLEGRIMGCNGSTLQLFGGSGRTAPGRGVRIRGIGVIAYDQLPEIVVHMPRRGHVAAGGAVWGQVAASDALDLAVSGCGDWRLADMAGALSVQAAGSGDVAGGRAGALDASLSGSSELSLGDIAGGASLVVAGSGGVRAGAVRGPVHLDLGGSGDVRLARVDGPISAQLASSGAVRIDAGAAPRVSVDVAGSGDFSFGGAAGAVRASVVGSGDVHVAHATGPVSRSVMGSGDVAIGR